MKICCGKGETFKVTDFNGKGLPSYIISRGRSKHIFWKDIAYLRKNFKLDITPDAKDKLKDIYLRRYKQGLWPQGITYLYNIGYAAFMHQIIGMEFLLRKKTVILADDVGLGKTLTFCGSLVYLLKKGLIKQGIIVTRTSIKYQTMDEIHRFFVPKTLSESDIVCVDGTPKKRLQQWQSNAKILITSYGQLRNDYKSLIKLRKQGLWDPQAWVLDEASSIKNRSTKIAKRVKKLSVDAEYRWAATATPIENGLTDLYSIAEFVQPGVFPSKKYFENKYCRFKKTKTGKQLPWKILLGYKNLDKAKKRLKGYYLQRNIKDIGRKLPPVMAILTCVEPTELQQKLYDKIKKQYTVLQAITYAKRVCDSPYLISNKFPKKSAKTDEILHLINGELKSEQVVIMTQYRGYLHLLSEAIDEPHGLIHGLVKPAGREIVRKKFQNGDLRIMIMTDAGEYGLNLQAGSVLINADLPWNAAKLKQRIGRIRRLGSKHDSIRVINLVIRNTIEERVIRILKDKEKIFNSIFTDDGSERIGDIKKQLGKKGLKKLL